MSSARFSSLRGVEVRALAGGEEAAERRQAEARLARSDAPEDDLEPLPQVAEAVVGAPLHRAVAQAAQAVALA